MQSKIRRAKLEEQNKGKGRESLDIQCQTEGVPGKDREDREEINQGQKGTMLCKLKEDLCPHTKKVHETVNKKTENVTFLHKS